MVTTQSKQITLEEFLALTETKPASEYIDGKIIQKPMPKGKHSIIQAELIIALNSVLKPQKIARIRQNHYRESDQPSKIDGEKIPIFMFPLKNIKR